MARTKNDQQADETSVTTAQGEADVHGSGMNESDQLPEQEAKENRQELEVDISKPHSMTPEEIKATQNATATATREAGPAVEQVKAEAEGSGLL